MYPIVVCSEVSVGSTVITGSQAVAIAGQQYHFAFWKFLERVRFEFIMAYNDFLFLSIVALFKVKLASFHSGFILILVLEFLKVRFS